MRELTAQKSDRLIFWRSTSGKKKNYISINYLAREKAFHRLIQVKKYYLQLLLGSPFWLLVTDLKQEKLGAPTLIDHIPFKTPTDLNRLFKKKAPCSKHLRATALILL